MILESRKFKKFAVVCVFISTLNISLVQPVMACEAFDEYQGQTCHQTVYTTYLRRVVSCANGTVIRYETLFTATTTVQYGRVDCVDGWNWCMYPDPECEPEVAYQTIVSEQVCE